MFYIHPQAVFPTHFFADGSTTNYGQTDMGYPTVYFVTQTNENGNLAQSSNNRSASNKAREDEEYSRAARVGTVNPSDETATVMHSNKKVKEEPAVYRVGKATVVDEIDKYVMTVDLPGVKAKDVTIKEVNGTLSIAAERKNGDKILSKFVQSISIDKSTMDVLKSKADLSDGVLTLTVPKKPEPEPITVSVIQAEPPALENDADEFQFPMDIPGVKLSDLRIKFHKGDLTVQGERKDKMYAGGKPSKIHRVFTLNESSLDTSKLKAYLMDGVLTICAPRKQVTSQKIEVSTFSTTDDDNDLKEKHVVKTESATSETTKKNGESWVKLESESKKRESSCGVLMEVEDSSDDESNNSNGKPKLE